VNAAFPAGKANARVDEDGEETVKLHSFLGHFPTSAWRDE